MRLWYLGVHPSAHLQRHPVSRMIRNHGSNLQADGVDSNSGATIRLDASDDPHHMKSKRFPVKLSISSALERKWLVQCKCYLWASNGCI